MSNVTIKVKSTDVTYDGTDGDVGFTFVHKGEKEISDGMFWKLNDKGNQTEHIGGFRVSPEGNPNIELRKSNSDFVADFQTCLGLVVRAIEHVKTAKK